MRSIADVPENSIIFDHVFFQFSDPGCSDCGGGGLQDRCKVLSSVCSQDLKIRLMEILRSLSAVFYFLLFQSLLIFQSPLFHRFDDGAHGFTEF